jgi:hypothetical protein
VVSIGGFSPSKLDATELSCAWPGLPEWPPWPALLDWGLTGQPAWLTCQPQCLALPAGSDGPSRPVSYAGMSVRQAGRPTWLARNTTRRQVQNPEEPQISCWSF